MNIERIIVPERALILGIVGIFSQTHKAIILQRQSAQQLGEKPDFLEVLAVLIPLHVFPEKDFAARAGIHTMKIGRGYEASYFFCCRTPTEFAQPFFHDFPALFREHDAHVAVISHKAPLSAFVLEHGNDSAKNDNKNFHTDIRHQKPPNAYDCAESSEGAKRAHPATLRYVLWKQKPV